MNAGDAADQVIRQVEKMIKNHERALRDFRFGKVKVSCFPPREVWSFRKMPFPQCLGADCAKS